MIAVTVMALMLAGQVPADAPAECRPQANGRIDYRACVAATKAGDPAQVLALINLAAEAYLHGDTAEALRLYDAAEVPGQAIQSDARFHAYRADVFSGAGRGEAALADAKESWRLLSDPSAYPTPQDRIVLTDAQRFDLLILILPILHKAGASEAAPARAAFDAITPADWAQYANRAVTLGAIGDAEGAAEASTRALETGPENAGLLNNHCYTLTRAGRAEEALGFCDRALALLGERADPGTVAATRHSRASTLAALGRCEAAEADMAMARDLAPGEDQYRTPPPCVPGLS